MKVGRNDPCSCGSGRKRKYCCERKHDKRDQMRDSLGKGVFYLIGPVLLAAIAAIAIGGMRAQPTDDGPPKVWSAAHNHWHYKLPDGTEIEVKPGMTWSKETGQFVPAAPLTAAARKFVTSNLGQKLDEAENTLVP